MKRQHSWTYRDELIAFMLYALKANSPTCIKVGDKLGMGGGSMGKKVANYKSLHKPGKGGLSGGRSKLTDMVFQENKSLLDVNAKMIKPRESVTVEDKIKSISVEDKLKAILKLVS